MEEEAPLKTRRYHTCYGIHRALLPDDQLSVEPLVIVANVGAAARLLQSSEDCGEQAATLEAANSLQAFRPKALPLSWLRFTVAYSNHMGATAELLERFDKICAT